MMLILYCCFLTFLFDQALCQVSLDENADIIHSDLPWERFENFLNPQEQIALPRHILEKKFVAVKTGISGTESALDYAQHANASTSTIYRFTFLPSSQPRKARLQLSTCFVTRKELRAKLGITDGNPVTYSPLITLCKAANTPQSAVHTYSHWVYLPQSGFPTSGRYIIAQFQGTPDSNILRDQHGCIARVGGFDRYRLCNNGGRSCQQGTIFHANGEPTGLEYQQGGYPPLTLHLDNGNFKVVARSDDGVFIQKGGCGVSSPIPSDRICPNYPRQQHHVLWELPIEGLPFDSWVEMRWRIKWSEYSTTNREGADPGILTSNSWIRLRINGIKVLDWKGPCGRNDEGRIPFFKTGIDNPTGSNSPITMYASNYGYRYKRPDQLKEIEKTQLRELVVQDSIEPVGIGQNGLLDNNLNFYKISGSCKLRSAGDVASVEGGKTNQKEFPK